MVNLEPGGGIIEGSNDGIAMVQDKMDKSIPTLKVHVISVRDQLSLSRAFLASSFQLVAKERRSMAFLSASRGDSGNPWATDESRVWSILRSFEKRHPVKN